MIDRNDKDSVFALQTHCQLDVFMLSVLNELLPHEPLTNEDAEGRTERVAQLRAEAVTRIMALAKRAYWNEQAREASPHTMDTSTRC